MTFVPGDVLVIPASSAGVADRWVAMNVFARTSLAMDGRALQFMGNPDVTIFKDAIFNCWEVGFFSNEEGLLADPTRIRRDVADWHPLSLNVNEFVFKLKEEFLFVDDIDAYRACFADKRTVLDRHRFGNFHQQHGQHLLLNRRLDPSKWWMDQKFNSDRTEVRRDNLYGAVQWAFLTNYFSETVKKGESILDVGCGTGIYSNFLASIGATVVGIDPSELYLSVARKCAVGDVEFRKLDVGMVGALESIGDNTADMIFMSDSLLFYFRPLSPSQRADIQVLLSDIRRILRPGGRFVTMEPHPAFFLMPWLGEPDRPFTVMTEYLHKNFGISPPMSWLVREIRKAGFGITDLREPQPAEYFKDVDSRAFHFAREFPVWQLTEMAALGRVS
jgi:ubiquinone/menaquinone biosynthesis C-methylase UbiE